MAYTTAREYDNYCAQGNKTYVDNGLSEDAVDLSGDGGLVVEVGVRADKLLEGLVVGVETAITKGVVEHGLALLLVGPGDTGDVEDGDVLGEGWKS